MTMLSKMFEPQPTTPKTLPSGLIPKIRIAAFYETMETAEAIAAAAADRRMMRAAVETQTGGIRAAIAQYRNIPSPDLVILERQVPADLLLEELEKLAEVCDVGTKVMVVGLDNDIQLYRKLIDRGISDYLVGPMSAPTLIASITRLYEEEGARKLGHTYAFVGAKGGVGSSTVAHNVAATMAGSLELDVILADMDLPFGTAGLDFNLDGAQGLAEVLENAGKLDDLLLERLLGKCSNRLNMLAAPVTLERPYDLGEEDFDEFVDVAKANAAHVVLDMPHVWTSWARRMLVAADEVIVTAAPDLANLRNTKNLVDALRKARPHDAPPQVLLNQVGMAKRSEIKPDDFAKAIQLDLVAQIAFEPKLFSTAANNGQMIAEIAARAAAPFRTVAESLVERGGGRQRSSSRGPLARFLLRRRPA